MRGEQIRLLPGMAKTGVNRSTWVHCNGRLVAAVTRGLL